MDAGTAAALAGSAVVAGGIGLALGAALARGADSPTAAPVFPAPGRALPLEELSAALSLLAAAALVLDNADTVLLQNDAARRAGLARGRGLVAEELLRVVRDVRRQGVARVVDLDLPRGRLSRDTMAVRARVGVLGPGGGVLVLVDDRTETERVDAVRRDFVANVSHELKTPVGALSVLAEAVASAAEDPEAVRRFATRLTREAGRLGRLVQELIDLSRLQGAELPPVPAPVSVDRVVAEAVDRNRSAAESKRMEVAVGGQRGVATVGDEPTLVTALSNLLENAIAYSPEGTRVAVGVHRDDDLLEISVTDQGIGIAPVDQARIFERFYRVDPARSRATGGTGLGLAIVKHVATNHGGEVTVWSQEGAGSTFTLRLPIQEASIP